MFQKKKRVGYRQESYESDDGIQPEASPQQETVELESTTHRDTDAFGGSRVRLSSESSPVALNPDGCCCCSARCFTTRCALLSTAACFLVTAFLILILDLGVNEAEVLARRHPYGNPIETENSTLVTFTLQGSPSSYKTFEVIPSDDLPQIYSVEMDYVAIDVDVFMTTFTSWRWKNLKAVVLRNVKLRGTLRHSNRIYRPDFLELFHLEYNEPIGREVNFSLDYCDRCATGNFSNWTAGGHSTITDRECLETLLLYRPHYDWSGNLAQMRFNYSLAIMGRTLVRLNNITGEITSTLPYSDELVRNATSISEFSHGIRQLRLRDTKLNVTTLTALSSSLVTLQLDNVQLVGLQGSQRVSQLLSNFNRLQNLCLKFGPFLDNPRLEVEPHVVILLDDLPSSLKTLTLAHVQLNINPGSTVNFHLENLTLYHTDILSDELIANFSRHFQVRNGIAWQIEGVKGQVKPKNNWDEVLVKLNGGGNPDWIFLDNSVLGPFLKTGGGLIRPLGNILTFANHAALTSTAVNFTYRRSPAGKSQLSFSPEALPKSRWFDLLHIDSFLEKRLLLQTNW